MFGMMYPHLIQSRRGSNINQSSYMCPHIDRQIVSRCAPVSAAVFSRTAPNLADINRRMIFVSACQRRVAQAVRHRKYTHEFDTVAAALQSAL